MKANLAFTFLLFAFFLLSYSSSAGLLTPYKEVGEGSDVDGSILVDDADPIDTTDVSELMGLESEEYCDGNDEECLERRMTTEAHLDYIYTQEHKP